MYILPCITVSSIYSVKNYVFRQYTFKNFKNPKRISFLTETWTFEICPSKRIKMNLYFQLTAVFQMSKYMKPLKIHQKIYNSEHQFCSATHFTTAEQKIMSTSLKHYKTTKVSNQLRISFLEAEPLYTYPCPSICPSSFSL